MTLLSCFLIVSCDSTSLLKSDDGNELRGVSSAKPVLEFESFSDNWGFCALIAVGRITASGRSKAQINVTRITVVARDIVWRLPSFLRIARRRPSNCDCRAIATV